MVKSLRILVMLLFIAGLDIITGCAGTTTQTTPPSSEDKPGKLRTFSEPYTKDNKDDHQSDSPRGSHTREDHNKSYHHDNDYYYADDDDDDDSFWGPFFGEVFGDIFSAILLADHGYRYSGYPYNNWRQSNEGVYISLYDTAILQNSNQTAFQLHTFYQRVDSDIQARGLNAKLLLPSSLTIDIHNTRYIEDLGNQTDSLNYFSMHFNAASFTPDTNVVIEMGLGFTNLTDVDGDTSGSGSFKMGLDYFPNEPWGLHLSTAYSSPADESLLSINSSISYHLKALEIFIGYNWLINSQGQNLDGTTFGLGLWF